jgi:hypothetical protein
MTADEIKTLIKRMRDTQSDCADSLNAASALESLSLESQRLRVDAERYRHLRECNGGSLIIVHITGMGDDDQTVLTEGDADAAIDAARSQSEAKP